MRRLIILGAVGVLAVVGFFLNVRREANSLCDDDFYVSRVHDEMRAELLEESRFLAALQDGAAAENVSPSDRATYSAAAQKLIADVGAAEVVGLAKHPSYEDLLTCHLTLTLDDPLAEFDLEQSTFLGFATDRQFEIVARFKINFEEITGVELQNRIDAQRNDQFLVETEMEGDRLLTATMAKLTRRAFDIHEPEFLEINYNTSIEAPGGFEPQYIGREE